MIYYAVLLTMLTFQFALCRSLECRLPVPSLPFKHDQDTIEFSTMLCYWAINYCVKYADLKNDSC